MFIRTGYDSVRAFRTQEESGLRQWCFWLVTHPFRTYFPDIEICWYVRLFGFWLESLRWKHPHSRFIPLPPPDNATWFDGNGKGWKAIPEPKSVNG